MNIQPNEKTIKWINRILYATLISVTFLLTYYSFVQMNNYQVISQKEILNVKQVIKTKIDSFFKPVILCDAIIGENWDNENDFYQEALTHEALYRKLVSLHPEIDSIYFGDELGNFVMYKESNTNQVDTKLILHSQGTVKTIWRYFENDILLEEAFVENDAFDHRIRPWYIKELSPGLNFINPYEFYTSGDQGLTFSRQLLVDGKLYGNYGIDVTITNIENFLSEINSDKKYFAYLSTQDGFPIANSLNSNKFLANNDFSEFLKNTYPNNKISLINNEILSIRDTCIDSVNNPIIITLFADYSEYFNIIKTSQYLALLISAILLWSFANAILSQRLHLKSRHSLVKIAMYDELTGLKNRHSFTNVFLDYLQQLKKENKPFSVVICDIDHFKKVNDNYGHNNGDVVLKELAKIIRETARDTDEVFRWGGEEFLILLFNADADKAYEVSERIRSDVENTIIKAGNHEIKCTLSFGICEYQEIFDDKELIKKADDKLYEAKRTGRNKICK